MARILARSVLVALIASAIIWLPSGGNSTDANANSGADTNSNPLYIPLVGSLSLSVETEDTVCVLPLGGQGVSYEVGPEVAPWGPSTLATGNDQTFWIADTAANRVAQYGRDCTLITAIDLDGLTTAPTDLAIGTDSLWVLDASSQQPAVFEFNLQGSLMAQQLLPEGLGSSMGLSGIRLSPLGDLLIEQENGAQYTQMASTAEGTEFVAISGLTYGDQAAELQVSGVGRPDSAIGHVKVGDAKITISVANELGGLSVLGFAPDGSFFVVLEEVALRDTILVDQRVQHYAANGTLLGEARVPVQEQYAYVANGLALGTQGEVYFLVTQEQGAEIRRLRFAKDLPPVIPTLEVPAKAQSASSAEAAAQYAPEEIPAHEATPEPFVTPAAPSPALVEPESVLPSSIPDNADGVQACTITRETIIANARAFLNNRIAYSDANINGTCSGRTKPRYFGAAGTYTSVPYDWGGKVSLATFNTRMAEGRQAGDIHTDAVESCSVGVDCSGYIARAWNVPAFDSACCENVGAWKLTTYSTRLSATSELQRGDILYASHHVVLFDSVATNGFYAYEATTDSSVDRVVYQIRSWTWVANGGYSPYRLKSDYLCASDPDDGRTIGVNQSLSGAINPATDVDTYYFDGSQGQIVEIRVNRTTDSPLDSYLYLYNPSGSLLASDDDGGGYPNSLIRATLPTTGRYRIEVKSYNGGTTGGYQLRVGSSQVPAAPTNLQATVVDANRIRLTWMDNSSNESGFKVYDGNTHVATAGANTTSYTVGGLAAGSYHCYRLVAYNNSGDSGSSGWACATTSPSGSAPAAPLNLRATVLDASRIQLNWTDNSSNESGFKVYDGNTYVATVGANTTSYIATGLAAGSYHCYHIFAYNSYGTSAWSGWACATTQSAGSPPATPLNLRATALDTSRIQLNWTDNSSNESGFRIYEGDTYRAAVGANVTSYVVTGLAANSYRCYRVFAYNGYGTSGWSGSACATTSSGSSSVNLALNKTAAASSFQESMYGPFRAVDGSTATRWSSRISTTLGQEWWRVDLGSVRAFNRVVIRWEAAYATQYFVGSSNDPTTGFVGSNFSATSPAATSHNLGTRSHRYVVVIMYQRAPRMNNYSMFEVEVYNSSMAVASQDGEVLIDAVRSSTEEVYLSIPDEVIR